MQRIKLSKTNKSYRLRFKNFIKLLYKKEKLKFAEHFKI